jgi:hypothetical protein
MHMLAMCSYQLHRGAAHARTGELHGLASWQASSAWRSLFPWMFAIHQLTLVCFMHQLLLMACLVLCFALI